jgi:ABC-type dipeptide/oligopeptide/nickel transport system ATPase component
MFISHDLRAVAALAQDIAVLKNGVVVEAGLAADVLASPAHPYTRSLLTAALANQTTYAG